MRRAFVTTAILTLALIPARAADAGPKTKQAVERYPASFRLAVEEAIQQGVGRLRGLQLVSGLFRDPPGAQALGHTALPVLAMLKAGVPANDPAIRSAFRAMATLPLDKTYSVACYLMAIHARYQPKLDTFDTDVGSMRAKRVKPEDVHARLSAAHRKAIERGVAFLSAAQKANGHWHYDLPANEKSTSYDLSNTQYALLGLRAAADCGVSVSPDVWNGALRALIKLQDQNGDKVDLLVLEVKDGYVFQHKDNAKSRPFRYTAKKKNGPKGEKTVPTAAATGSMTCAGIACVAICVEGLWHSRSFRGRDRKKAKAAIRDGRAWLQEHFTVAENPGHPRNAHHRYYLYGLERMGMLIDARYIGKHDWYKEGADLLLSTRDARGGWGRHVQTSFGILFLKRATAPTVAVTGD